MPDLDQQRISIANQLQRQIAMENELTVAQARAFVRGLQTNWRVPTIQWRKTESQNQYEDARRLLNAAFILHSIDSENSAVAKLCYRRAAELLEWLSRAGDNLATIPLDLLAAASYQLADNPAMSTALLAMSKNDHPGERLFSNYLRADFDEVINDVVEFWKENLDLTKRESTSRLLLENGDDIVVWFVTVELVRVLGLLANSIRRGETDRFKLAKRKLNALDRLSNRSFNDEISLLVTLLLQVTNMYDDTNIFNPVRQLGRLNPECADRLEGFARRQFSFGRGILWSSQRKGLIRLQEKESFALCTPTGSGKTLVAILAIVKVLLLKAKDDVDPLALYLVPSRALASEVEAKISNELSNDFTITGLYGGTDWGITDYWLRSDKPTVLIATVEKTDALMRYLGPLLLKRLRLLIVDEAHQVVPENNERTQDNFSEHSSRPLRLEAFVSRLLSCAPDIERIALTAVAGGAAPTVACWIENQETAEPVGSDYRSTRQIIGSFETAPNESGRMLLEILNGKQLFVRRRGEQVYINLRTPSMPQLPANMRNSIYRFNQLDVLWTSLHLAKSGRRILISVAQQPEQTIRWFKEALSLQSWDSITQFNRPVDGEDLLLFESAYAACVDYCGGDSYETKLLDHGIAINYGQMPHRIRRLMHRLIDRGICPITVATSTLTEGVNLPFDIIFITDLKRRSYNFDTNQQEIYPISTSEFRNLAGRAGRPGAGNGLEGITLVAIPVRHSSTASKTIPIQLNQIEQLQAEWQTLKQALLAENERINVNSPMAMLLNGIAEKAHQLLNIEGDEFLDWLERVIPSEISDEIGSASDDEMARLADNIDELDGVLLSALEELQRINEIDLEGAEAEIALSNIWQRSFTVFAATQEAWMENAFIKRGVAFFENLYPDRDERSRLYQYGFTPYVGRSFEKIVPEIMGLLRQADDYGESDNVTRMSLFEDIGKLLIDNRAFGFRVRSTLTDQKILNNWTVVMNWWLHGPDYQAPEPKDLRDWQRFVSDNLEFRLGVCIGAVVARAWSDGVKNDLVVPSLDKWRETTELPWFGFWARELLRWGTLDPFVAFALAEGFVGTRDNGRELRLEFDEWLEKSYEDVVSEDHINPQLFLEWKRSLRDKEHSQIRKKNIRVEIDGTSGGLGKYSVIPIVKDDSIFWIDASGFTLARSPKKDFPYHGWLNRDDYLLYSESEQPYVRRTFVSNK